MSREDAPAIAGRVVAVSPFEVVVAFGPSTGLGAGASQPPLGASCEVDRGGDGATPCRVVVIEHEHERTRCAAVDTTIDLRRGATVTLLDARAAAALVDPRPAPMTFQVRRSAAIATGVPVIDELAPLVQGGVSALVGLDHAPCSPIAIEILDRLAEDASWRIVLVGAESQMASWLADAPRRAPIERCTFADGALPGAVLLALVGALDVARETAPPRAALVVLAGADGIARSLATLGLRGRARALDHLLDALVLAEATCVLAWSTPADELDEDPLYAEIASVLQATQVVDRAHASLGARWPLDPLRSTSRHDPADPQRALELRALIARGRVIRDERLAVLGRDQLDPADRIELARATIELHRLVGLPAPGHLEDIIQ